MMQPNISYLLDLCTHIQNHAPLDRAGMHAREHVVDVLEPLGGDSGTHLSRTGEGKCLLQIEPCQRSSPAP